MNEVIAPDMIAILWPQPYTGSVLQPKPSFLRLFLWNLQPLSSPEPLNTAVANWSTCFSEQSCNPAITVSAKLSGQFDHICHQPVFIRAPFGGVPLSRTMLPQNSTSSTLRDFKLATHMIDASTTTGAAYKFPRVASFKINLSSVRSDTARLKRPFSLCKSFSCFNWSKPIPLYWVRQR